MKRAKKITLKQMQRAFYSIFILVLFCTFNASAQDYDFGETPDDSVNCVKNYSLYIEYFKQKNYKEAQAPLEEVYKYCPKFHKSIYTNGTKVYQKLIKASEGDKAKQMIYVDSLLSLYDKRIKYFGEEGYVLGRKGVDLYRYKDDNTEEVYNTLKKSYDLEKDESEANAIYYYYKSLFLLYAKTKDKAKKEELLNLYDDLSGTLDKKLASDELSDNVKDGYQKVYDEVDKMFSKVASCEDLLELYSKKFEAEPDNEDLLKTITRNLDKKNCTDNELFFNSASKLHEIQPSYESAVALAINQKDNCGKAAEFFIQAAEMANDNEKKTKALMNASKCYLKIGQYSSSRTHARKALEINPNLGDAYIVIGTAYAASAGQCGDNNCTSKAAYWVAVDKFAKAKSVDPSVAEEATENINKYAAYFPGKEDCFFHNITDGSSYTVGCWINETTTARFNK